jgi:exopolysaccharide production protein ExoQ
MGFHLPPTIALLLAVAFIVFLFRRDTLERPNVSHALWLPLIWMLIICSRQFSEWLTVFGLPGHGASTLEQGSPLDAWFYFGLIAAGIYVLNKRQVQLSEIFRNNGWLMAFLLYCFIAILWSDFPFVAFKRWIKILGHPIMALILFTEPDPEEAVVTLMKRCAYVIVPVSILFIKYYPEWGRGFDPWSGTPFNTGITLDKNALGHDCMILGCFFFWHLLQTWRIERSKVRRNELLLTVGFLSMIWWLVSMAQSSTSLVCLVLGVLTIALLGLRCVNKRLIGTYVIAVVIIWVVAEAAFGISAHVLEFLHRDPTLTNRTVLWDEVLKVKINPIFGVGFESFWLGDRFELFAEKYWWQPNEAHNGYLETYLNLGLIGLFLLIGLIVATFRKIRLDLLRNSQFARFRLGFLVGVVLYNWTEASFKTTSAMWFVFYIIAIEHLKFSAGLGEAAFGVGTREPETGLIYAQED